VSLPQEKYVTDDAGAARLVGAMLRGKDLPIDPLPWWEWDFRKCPTWERSRCWEYEFQRESKRVRAGITKWREEFPKWIEWRLKEAEKDWDWESVRDPKTGEWITTTFVISEKEKQERRERFESFYLAFEAPVAGWLLRDFPEFPEQAYLSIDKAVRKKRLAQWDCTPRQPQPVFPLDTVPVTSMLGEVAKHIVGLNFDDLPPALQNPLAHLAAWRAKIAEAYKEDDLPFQHHHVTRRLGKGHMVTDVVVTIPWYESKKRLVKRFAALLEELEKNLPEKAQVLGGSGSRSPGDMLKKLGAFRLMRHCRGNWKLAAEMSARVLPKAKALYDNESRWKTETNEVDELLEMSFTANGYDKPLKGTS